MRPRPRTGATPCGASPRATSHVSNAAHSARRRIEMLRRALSRSKVEGGSKLSKLSDPRRHCGAHPCPSRGPAVGYARLPFRAHVRSRRRASDARAALAAAHGRRDPTSSWWLERLPAGAAPPPGARPPSSADVVVIGAGAAGCAIAFHLRELRPELGRRARRAASRAARPVQRRPSVGPDRRSAAHGQGPAPLHRRARRGVRPHAHGRRSARRARRRTTRAGRRGRDRPRSIRSRARRSSGTSRATRLDRRRVREYSVARLLRGATVFADALQFFPAKVTAALLRASRGAGRPRASSASPTRRRARSGRAATRSSSRSRPPTARRRRRWRRHVVVATARGRPRLPGRAVAAAGAQPGAHDVAHRGPAGARVERRRRLGRRGRARAVRDRARRRARVRRRRAFAEPGAAIGSTGGEPERRGRRAPARSCATRSRGARGRAPGSCASAEWTGVLGSPRTAARSSASCRAGRGCSSPPGSAATACRSATASRGASRT